MDKNCDECGKEIRFKKTDTMIQSPQVLVVQYKHFSWSLGHGFRKIDHDIHAPNKLKLNNVMYQLTGIVVHQGASIHSGHYYAIMRCWETGATFKLNDSAKIEFVNNDDFEREKSKAYMLVFNKKDNEQDEVVNPTERSNNSTEEDSTNNVIEEESTNDVSEGDSTKYPQLKRRQMTAAGRKAASRRNQTEEQREEVRRVDRERIQSESGN